MVVILPDDTIDAWLDAPVERSFDFIRQFPTDRLVAKPEPVAPAAKKIKVVQAVRAVREVRERTDPGKGQGGLSA